MSDTNTLVLNRNYAAVHITGLRKVMAMLYTGEAVAVDDELRCYDFKDWVELSAAMAENRNGFVNTVTMRVAVPEIVRLTKYDRLPRRDVKFTRNNVYQHYKKKCCYCGEKIRSEDATWDHVVPRSRGGKSGWTNIVLACRSCNGRKADKTPAEAGMTLLVKPTRPEWHSVQTAVVTSPVPIPVSWQALVDRAYWDSELEE